MPNLSLRFKQYVSDPTLCGDIILSDIMAATGNEVVEANNAFVMLMEMTTHLASQNLITNQLGLKRRYASLATTFEDIYLHMTPHDIYSMFAKPTSASMRVSVLVESLLAGAVNVGAYREAIIPKYSEVHVDDLVFSLSRAVSIRIYNNRIFKVSYVDDSGIHADIAMLNSNQTYTRSDGALWLTFVIDVEQVNYHEVTLSALSGLTFDEQVSYTDQLSSIHLQYWKNNAYQTLPLTLTNRVYDPLTPYAIITPNIETKRVSLFVPSMYTSGDVSGNIKVTIGTTLGDIDRVFTHYTPEDYLYNLDTNVHQVTASEAAFIATAKLFEITSPLSGGRDALTKESIRSRIISRSNGNQNRPITRAQMNSVLADYGMSLVMYQEGIGGRTYIILDDTPHPTKNGQVPTPIDTISYYDGTGALSSIPSQSDDYIYKLAKQQTYTGASSRLIPYDTQLPVGTLTLTTHYDQLVLLPNVKVFSTGITLTPDTLFVYEGSSISPTSVLVSDVDAMTHDAKVNLLNMNPYVFSLFYYGISPNNGQWTIISWTLNTPSVHISDRVDADPAMANIFVRTHADVLKTNAGFTLRVYCTDIVATNVYTHTDTTLFVRIQTPSIFFPGTTSNQGNDILLQATSHVEDDLMVYEVDIASDFQLTETHIGLVHNLETYFIEGTAWVDLIYCLNTKPVGYVGELGSLITDTTVGAMLHERLYTSFGEPLKHLWVNPHGIGDKVMYKTHESDVPYTVTETTLHSTVAEAIPFEFNDACEVVYKPIVTTNTTVMENNQIVYKHRKGDLVLDILGRPIPINTDYQQLTFDVMCVDARAVYCTDATILDQMDLVVRDITYKATTVVESITPQMLERTTLLYRPIRTIGETIAFNGDKSVGAIALSVRPVVVLGVTAEVYNDATSRKRLQDMTVQTLNLSLARPTISYDRILVDLKQVYGTSVISVKVNNLPDIIYDRPITLKDDTVQCVVDVQLIQSPNGPLTLADYITVQYNVIA
jgi:hypothetical protein